LHLSFASSNRGLVALGLNENFKNLAFADARISHIRFLMGELRSEGVCESYGSALELMIAGPEGGPSSDMQRYEG